MENPKLKMVYSKAEDVFEVKVFEVGDRYRICHFGPLGHDTLLDMYETKLEKAITLADLLLKDTIGNYTGKEPSK